MKWLGLIDVHGLGAFRIILPFQLNHSASYIQFEIFHRQYVSLYVEKAPSRQIYPCFKAPTSYVLVVLSRVIIRW